MSKGHVINAIINAISNFTGYAVSIALGIISYPIIINQIGLDAVGIYALIMAVLMPMDLANLGFAEATIKYVAQFAQANDYEKVKQYLSTTLTMSLMVGITGMIIIFFAGPPVAYSLFDIKSESFDTIKICFWMVAAGWLIRQLTTVFVSIPTAFQRFKIVGTGNMITSVITTLSILATIYFERNLIGYTLGTLIGAVLSLMFWYIMALVYFRSLNFSIRIYREVWLSSFSYGGWQTIGNVAGIVTNQADKYLLGVYLPPSASGVYNVIFQMQQKILSCVFKVAEVLFPIFSALSQQDQQSKFNALTRSNYMITVIGVLIFFPLIILAHPILNLWINADFAEKGSLVMKCLLLIGTFASVSVVQIFFLMGNAQVRQTTFITYFTGALTILGAFLFIPRYGLNGAGYGVLFASVVRLLPLYFIMKGYFKEAFVLKKYLYATGLPIVAGAAILVLFHVAPIFNPQNFIMLVVDYGIIALIIFGFISIGNYLIPHARSHNEEVVLLIQHFKGMLIKK
jgi:O-antigen/teichoic acid export membrane protein